MKNEAKNNFGFTQLIQDLYKLRIELLNKDEQLATDNILKRRVLLKPPTTYPPTHRLTDPPTAFHELKLKQRPDSKHALYSEVYENFGNHLFLE